MSDPPKGGRNKPQTSAPGRDNLVSSSEPTGILESSFDDSKSDLSSKKKESGSTPDSGADIKESERTNPDFEKSKLAMANLENMYPSSKNKAYNSFRTQFRYWVNSVESTDTKWTDILRQLEAHSTQLSATEAEEKSSFSDKVAYTPPPSKCWADYNSDSSTDDEMKELTDLMDESSESPGVYIPDDLSVLWPKGYSIIKEACAHCNLTLIPDKRNLASGGFRYSDFFDSSGPEETKKKYAALDKDGKAAISAFKSLIVFLKIQPDALLAQDSKFAVPASYILHFLLKTGDAEKDSRNTRCLKHRDGGRFILETRLNSMFLANRMVGSNLLLNLDKLYRARARIMFERQLVKRELRELILNHCFTSPEGMLSNFYVKERRKEQRSVEKLNAKGKPVIQKEWRLVDGRRVPALGLGSELVKVSEKERLRKFEARFNLPNIMRSHAERSVERGEGVEDLAILAENLVKEAYSVTKGISSVIKQRKNMLRSFAKEGSEKITPSVWQSALNKTLEDAISLPESVYQGIEQFLVRHGA